MGRIAIEDFVGVRTRFQRLSDAKFFSGWITDFNRDNVVVTANNQHSVMIGDQFRFEGHGLKFCVAFFGKLAEIPQYRLGSFGSITTVGNSNTWVVESKQLEVEFEITSSVMFGTAREEMRIMAPDIPITIRAGRKSFEAISTDMSRHGLGMYVKGSPPIHCPIEIECQTKVGSISFIGEARYSIVECESEGTYRVGVKLDKIDRINEVKWGQLLNEFAWRFECKG